MTKETNHRSATVKKETKKSKKRDELLKKKKNHESSDDDDDESYHPSDTEEEEMDEHEYRKFLQKIFPSKHLEKKIKAGEKLKKTIDLEEED